MVTRFFLKIQSKEEKKKNHRTLCAFDHTTHYQWETSNISFWGLCSLPTLGGCIAAFGISSLDPFPKETRVYEFRHHEKLARKFSIMNTNAHPLVSFTVQTEAEITGSCGRVWRHASQRWSYTDPWGGRRGAHTHKRKNTLSLVQIHTLALPMFFREDR